ncbi:hypothetical protein HDU76_010450 [Blyttiomyces sp. JEL0837]|nr:hypothetical protein HDU76_010450 [Blyttiomyces sp. JEL0837]
MADPYLPKTKPIHSMVELAAWDPEKFPDHFSKGFVPLQSRPSRLTGSNSTRPDIIEIIFCHDMGGGYNEDAFPQGMDGPWETLKDLYTLQYWTYVDKFIYFTHARIGIPPPGWTNAAHRNGVIVYATYITEWEAGELETLKWIYGPDYNPTPKEVPSDKVESRYPVAKWSKFYADKMVQLAKHYAFDGWFINIESDLRSTTHALEMRDFIAYLTSEMHKQIPGSKVLWYDSVTVAGRLRWQDELNVRNLAFFNVCDGIFVNYTWGEHKPFQSARISRLSPALQRGDSDLELVDRTREVYTGCDIWGRNTFGGGGFNAHKALRVISKAQTSAALFAPGWTREYFPEKDKFHERELRLWCGEPRLLNPVFPPWDPEGPPPTMIEDESDLGSIRDYVKERLSGTKDYFYTDFDRGVGESYYIRGKQVSGAPWFNISRQHAQPTYRTIDSLFTVSEKSFQNSRMTQNQERIHTVDIRNSSSQSPYTRTPVSFGPSWSGGSALEVYHKDFVTCKDAFTYIPLFDIGVSFPMDDESAKWETWTKVKLDSGVSSVKFGIFASFVIRLDESNSEHLIQTISVDQDIVNISISEEGWREISVDLKDLVTGSSAVVTQIGLWLSNSPTFLDSSAQAQRPVLRIGEAGVGRRKAQKSREVAAFAFELLDVITKTDDAASAFCTVAWRNWRSQVESEVMESGYVDRWEVFIDEVWVGTAHANMFRGCFAIHGRKIMVRVEGVNEFGASTIVLHDGGFTLVTKKAKKGSSATRTNHSAGHDRPSSGSGGSSPKEAFRYKSNKKNSKPSISPEKLVEGVVQFVQERVIALQETQFMNQLKVEIEKHAPGFTVGMDCICYGIGPVNSSRIAQHQLALCMYLHEKYKFSRLEMFDPVFNELDIMILKKLGCHVLEQNEHIMDYVSEFPFPNNYESEDVFNNTSVHWFPKEKLDKANEKLWDMTSLIDEEANKTFGVADDPELIT